MLSFPFFFFKLINSCKERKSFNEFILCCFFFEFLLFILLVNRWISCLFAYPKILIVIFPNRFSWIFDLSNFLVVEKKKRKQQKRRTTNKTNKCDGGGGGVCNEININWTKEKGKSFNFRTIEYMCSSLIISDRRPFLHTQRKQDGEYIFSKREQRMLNIIMKKKYHRQERWK